MINDTQGLILGAMGNRSVNTSQILDELQSLEPLWMVTRSQVYREVNALLEKGLIAFRHPNQAEGVAVIYKITEDGKDEHAEWRVKGIKDRIKLQDPLLVRCELDLRETGRIGEDIARLGMKLYTEKLANLIVDKHNPISLLIEQNYLMMFNWFKEQVNA